MINTTRWDMLTHIMKHTQKIKSILYKEYSMYDKIEERYKTDLEEWTGKGRNNEIVIGAILDGIITVAFVEYEEAE